MKVWLAQLVDQWGCRADAVAAAPSQPELVAKADVAEPTGFTAQAPASGLWSQFKSLALGARSAATRFEVALPKVRVLQDLSENDWRELSFLALLNPEKMPSLAALATQSTPEERDVLKRFHTAFYSLQPVDKKLEKRAFQIFLDLIPREANGRMIPHVPQWEHHMFPFTVHLNAPTTPAQITRAQALGLPLFTEGQLSLDGTRHHSGWLDSDFYGYHIFTASDGRRFYSLRPLYDDATAEDIVALYRFIAARTAAQGIMAKPLGVHFYRGEPRILFEILQGRRMFEMKNTDSELPFDFERKYDAVMSGHLCGHKRIHGRFGDDAVLNEDYMFICDGEFRVGLQVRVGDFIDSVRAGKVFRLLDPTRDGEAR